MRAYYLIFIVTWGYIRHVFLIIHLFSPGLLLEKSKWWKDPHPTFVNSSYSMTPLTFIITQGETILKFYMFFGFAGGSSRWKVHLLPCISSPMCDRNMCVWKTVNLNKTFWNRCKCFTPCTHYFQIIDQKSFWRFTVTQVNTCKFKTAGQQILNQECDSRFHNKKLLQFHESSSFFFFLS